MPFEFEKLSDNEASSLEMKEVISYGRGTSIFHRFNNKKRNVQFYCLSLGGGPEGMKPGDFLLKYKNDFISIKALFDKHYEEKRGRIFNFTVSNITFPESYSNDDKNTVLQIIEEAFVTYGLNMFTNVSVVEVDLSKFKGV